MSESSDDRFAWSPGDPGVRIDRPAPSGLADPAGQRFRVVPGRTPAEVAALVAGVAPELQPSTTPVPRPEDRRRRVKRA